ncbi:TPA: hypothetical protein NPN74_001618 [Klebsiella quasipneumoniae subsp. quasipneumoniae]|nr:hypothetical protein [Klebsiella quasipneumoniae subsp. quasipneumoniae]
MRKFEVIIETPFVGGEIVEQFEVEDDATEEEIKEEARDIFFNNCNYGYHEITGEEE